MARQGNAIVLAVLALCSLGRAFAQEDAAGDEAGAAVGAQRQVAFRLAHGWSDNFARAGSNESDGSFNSAGVLANFQRQTRRLQAGLNADLDVRKYSDLYENEVLGTLSVFGDADLIENRLAWTFTSNHGQARSNVLAAEGPGNRERVSVTTTGPQLTVPFGGRTELALSGLYSDRRYEESDTLDSEAVTYDLGVYRQINTTTQLGLAVQTTQVEYDASLGYDVDSVSLRYERVLATGGVSAEVGRNRLAFVSSESSGSLLRLAWNRALAPRSRLGLSANREFGDSGELLDLAIGATDARRLTDVLLAPNPLQLDRIGLSYDFTARRTSASLRVASFTEEYQANSAFNNDGVDIQLTINRQLTPQLNGGLAFGRLRREFGGLGQHNVDEVAWLFVDRQFGRNLNLSFNVERNTRDGQDAFKETLYEVRLVWGPRALQRSGIPPSGSGVGQQPLTSGGQAAR
jgi:hypothetical protein